MTDVAGEPIESARINAWDYRSGRNFNARTSRRGMYTLRGLAKDAQYQLNVSHPEHSSSGGQFRGGTKDADFVLKGLGNVTGIAVDGRTGEPLDSFEAMVRGSGGPLQSNEERNFQIFANEEGRFTFDKQPVGEFVVYARAEGYAPGFENATIHPDETTDGIVVRLFEGAGVRGTVVAEDGSPVLGASIFIDGIPDIHQREREAMARTDAKGEFVLEELPASASTIFAWQERYVVGSSALNLNAGGESNVRITLPSGATVEGTITNQGTPVGNAYISISQRDSNGRESKSTRSDENGYYVISGLTAGTSNINAQRTVTNSPSATINREVDVPEGGSLNADFDFDSGNAGIEGYVTFRGEPVTEARLNLYVELSDGSMQRAWAEIDSRGYYIFEGQPSGAARLQARSYGREQRGEISTNVELIDGQIIKIDVELAGDHVITGQVSGLSEGGQAQVVALLEGAVPHGTYTWKQSDFQVLNNAGRVGVAGTEPGGAFTITNMRPGRYTLLAIEIVSEPTPETEFRVSASPIEVTAGIEEVRADFSF